MAARWVGTTLHVIYDNRYHQFDCPGGLTLYVDGGQVSVKWKNMLLSPDNE